MLAACRACHPKWSFLTIKKRLRQAASRGKWCFSPRNAILGKKKSACGKPPAGGKWFWSSPTREPLVHPNKGAIGAPQEGNHWCTPRREPLVHPNKGAIGSPKQRSHWFTSTREPLVHPKEPLVHPKEPLVHPKWCKNTKIVTKWSSMGRNRTATLPK